MKSWALTHFEATGRRSDRAEGFRRIPAAESSWLADSAAGSYSASLRCASQSHAALCLVKIAGHSENYL